jgi:uncharacterized membrane protein
MPQRNADSADSRERRDKQLPVDLLFGALLVVGADAAVLLNAALPVRLLVGIPALLVVPGYAIVSFLFPGRLSTSFDQVTRRLTAGSGSQQGPEREEGYAERLLLAVGASVVSVPTILVTLLHTGVRLDSVLVMLVVSGVSLPLSSLAVVRRRRVPADERFGLSSSAVIAAAGYWRPPTDSSARSVSRAFFVLTVLLAVASVGYAMGGQPSEDGDRTEFYLLSENETGALAAENYTSNLTAGQDEEYHVGVTNNGESPQRYTVVAELQAVSVDGETVRTVEAERLKTTERRVAPGRTWQGELTVEPTMTGDRLRLTFLLYRGDAPVDATTEDAHRSVHLWVSVSGGNRR